MYQNNTARKSSSSAVEQNSAVLHLEHMDSEIGLVQHPQSTPIVMKLLHL